MSTIRPICPELCFTIIFACSDQSRSLQLQSFCSFLMLYFLVSPCQLDSSSSSRFRLRSSSSPWLSFLIGFPLLAIPLLLLRGPAAAVVCPLLVPAPAFPALLLPAAFVPSIPTPFDSSRGTISIKKSNMSEYPMAAATSDFCKVRRLFDWATSHARDVSSAIKTVDHRGVCQPAGCKIKSSCRAQDKTHSRNICPARLEPRH